MKNKVLILIFSILAVNTQLFTSCNTQIDIEKNTPILSTDDASSISQHSAISGGLITSDNGSDITTRGVCWSLKPNPTIADSITEDAAGTGKFTSTIKNLISDTTYYVRAYATNKYGTGYGLQIEFKTLISYLPVCNTTVISDITDVSAISGGTVSNNADKYEPIIEKGICYSTQTAPTIENDKVIDGQGTGVFKSNLTKLNSRTTYYVRAYAINRVGIKYGNEYSFKTLGVPTIQGVLESPYIYGYINDYGGTDILSFGVCWNTTGNPTINSNKKEGVFYDAPVFRILISELGLTNGTTYYLRAYATNKFGTGYGEQIVITP